MLNDRKLTRSQAKIKLQNLPQDFRKQSSQKITELLLSHETFIHSDHIACYIPMEYELDIWPIIKFIWQHHKHCYLPALLPEDRHYLCFISFLPDDPLMPMKSYPKILEPVVTPEKIFPFHKLDLVILPFLGFTKERFRLGHGAGCYDRTFAFKQHVQAKPKLLGVGYECQQIQFEPGSWDVAMDEVIVV